MIAARLGSRQGGLVGAIVFNSVYKLALDALRVALINDDLTLDLLVPRSLFWSENFTGVEKTHFSDCAFVDDECVIIMRPNAEMLDKAIPKVLSHIARIFGGFGLEINFKPGKTEAMIAFRGYGTNNVINRRVVDGKLKSSIPGHQVDLVTTSKSYKP